MSHGITVRPARESEYVSVGKLTVAGYDADGYLVLPDGTYDDAYAAWLADIAGRARDSTVLVATDGSDLLGTVTWCPAGSTFAQQAHQPHQGELRTLSVTPSARRRGVARLLLADCLQRANTAGVTEVLLHSLPEMTSAHSLYLSEGFVRRPDLDWSRQDGIVLLGFSRSS